MKHMLTRLRKLEQDAPTGGGRVVIPAGEYRLAETVQCAWTERFAAFSPTNADMINESRERAAKYTPQLQRFDGPPLHAAQLTLSLDMQMTLDPCRDVPDWKRARELFHALTDAMIEYQRSTRDLYPLVERDPLTQGLRELATPREQRRPRPRLLSSEARDEYYRLLTEPDYVHPHLRTPPEQAPWEDTAPRSASYTTPRSATRTSHSALSGSFSGACR